jgi:translation initiation factor IF-3
VGRGAGTAGKNIGEASIARFSTESAPSKDGPRVNDQIESPKIRLVDGGGEMVGVVSLHEGLQRAYEAGLDLVEVSPNADPPVCKLLDLGKYKYELQKKANEARKKQKVIEIKEIKLRPGIDDHDYEVKRKAMVRFLEEGDKVKVNIRFKGREMAHQELGMQMAARIEKDLADEVVIEQRPRLEGRQMIMMVAPKRKQP